MFSIKYFLFIQVGLLHLVLAQNRSCLKSYTDVVVFGNDLTSVAGASSTCCQACQANAQCLAYVWTNDNGGTCWLKSDVLPLVNLTSANLTNAFTGIMSPTDNETYSLIKSYEAPTFFDDFWFDNRAPHSFGFGQFVGDNATAWEKGLINYVDGKVYIGVDHTTVEPNTSYGRLTIQIKTYQIYNSGLFILSMDHYPTGPYSNDTTTWQDSPVWPSWWMTGDYAYNGEFDMFEGYNPLDMAFVTLHDWDKSLYGNCTMPPNITSYFNGTGIMYNGACQKTPAGTADVPFNKAGGGAYAMQWDHGKFIRMWTFTKATLPADIVNGNPNPNPSTWGIPHAYFPMSHCHPDIMTQDYLVFDIAFCNPPFVKDCEFIVRSMPESFKETYFLINYMKVFCRPNEQCLTGFYGSGK